MRLPEEFEKRMKEMLGDEYPAFLEGFQHEPFLALRVNTCKLSTQEFQKMSPFSLRPVPWAAEGFYYEKTDRPGKHPWHEAGLYYIQEPSAMAVAPLAEAQPGERILDLCAAPGGKTTQLAMAMKGKGLLVSNEIHPARARILSSNVERMGITHAVVTNETPKKLAERFPAFFDRILVDAPCSGEGMFRKEEQALLQWSAENVRMCVRRQQEILDQAAEMLRPGGVLVYSTCTFAPEEDEGSVAAFLCRHPEFSVKKIQACESFSSGNPAWAGEAIPENVSQEEKERILQELSYTFRLWPHRLEGEGHFAAVLQKAGEARRPRKPEEDLSLGQSRKKGARTAGGTAEAQALKLWEDFARDTLTRLPEGIPALFGEQLFLLPCMLPLSGLKVLRAGLHLGTIKKNRFEPSHALALALRAEDAKRVRPLLGDSTEIKSYLRGESLEAPSSHTPEKGWTLVLVDGYPAGWGKQSGGTLKNHYPKGLRLN